MFETDFFSLINTKLPELGGRIYPDKLETGSDLNPTLPAAVYREQNLREVEHNSDQDTAIHLIQLDIYHTNYDELAALVDSLRQGLWRFQDEDFAAVNIQYSRNLLESEVHRKILGLNVIHRR